MIERKYKSLLTLLMEGYSESSNKLMKKYIGRV